MHNTQLVGIVNLTPDSFSDGGRIADARIAISQLIKDGADVVDIGAESTRPGATPISVNEEWARLSPVLPHLPAGVFSLDTRHAEVAKKALPYVRWINDVSGFSDVAMIEAVKNAECKLVMMHSLSVPADKHIVLPPDADVVQTLVDWARGRIKTLAGAGIAKDRIIFDPGVGFGKTPAQSHAVVDRVEEFYALGVPLLIGHSRKSFLGGKMEDRDQVTLEVSKKLWGRVDYLRVHNVTLHRKHLHV